MLCGIVNWSNMVLVAFVAFPRQDQTSGLKLHRRASGFLCSALWQRKCIFPTGSEGKYIPTTFSVEASCYIAWKSERPGLSILQKQLFLIILSHAPRSQIAIVIAVTNG